MIKKPKKRKRIEPQYLYGPDGKVKLVYLTAEDYKAFMQKLERLSKEARELTGK